MTASDRPHIAVIIQARMGSSRLPGKVLMPLAGKPLLVRMLERVARARTPFSLVVAATTDPADDPIQRCCEDEGLTCFRGHPTDLLDRHVQAARDVGADAVVKIPSDCPLIDPAIIDEVLTVYLEQPGRYDYVSNLHPATWPDGNDVEIMSLAALETAWREAAQPHEREHTTPFLWDQPERFSIGNVVWSTGQNLSMSHRLTIDYPEDYALIREVYDALYPHDPFFGLTEILRLLEAEPRIRALNAAYAGVNWYRNHLDDLRTVGRDETRHPTQ